MTQASIVIEDLAGSTPEKVMKIVHISGQLDESNVDEKIQEIYKAVEANPKNLNLVLDLENLEYMNSKSIGYITDLYGKVTDSGGQVVIVKARPNIVDILTVVGLIQLIKSFATLEEAQASLGSSTATTLPAPEPISAAESTPPTPTAPEPIQTTPVPATPAPVEAAPVEPIAAPTIPSTPVTPAAPEVPAAELTINPAPVAPAPQENQQPPTQQ